MFELLLLVISCYALAALSVHLAYRIRRKRLQESRHYVLVADDRQNNMEWYMRSLFSFSRRMGKDVRLTIIDRGASEETLAIVERLARDADTLKVHPSKNDPELDNSDSKRSQPMPNDATGLLWLLQSKGIVSHGDHAVLIDLQNPEDLSKMPF